MLTSNAQAPLGETPQLTARVEQKGADPVANLVERFGDRMSASQVADALGYSHTYFQKKIGSKDYAHLDWVQALKPARVRHGRAHQYKTLAVGGFMLQRGLL